MYFFNLYKIYKNRIDKKLSRILNQLPFQKSNLLKAMRYSMFSGSKRLRPCLVYATGETFKVNIVTLDIISAAIECIHSYSLIHDDLPCMDNDDTRRGRSSCHIKYGENISLLAGDALQSLAFNILSTSFMPDLSDLKRINMISELSNSIGSSGMCIGQMLDLESEKQEFDLFELENINLYKTAFLIRSSVRLAYFSSENFSQSVLSILDCFSTSIGLAFQIQDDILDLKNDISKVEKNQKNVKKSQKNTYPIITGLERSHKRIKILRKKALLALDDLKKKYDVDNLKRLTKFMIKYIE